jgi:hypothetical protein
MAVRVIEVLPPLQAKLAGAPVLATSAAARS